jgi:hypothetical protein
LRGFEFVKPAPVLGNIRTGNIDDGVEQRHSFRKHCGNVLSALDRHLAQAGVRIGVDIERTANDIHRRTIIPKAANVEMAAAMPWNRWQSGLARRTG